MGGCRFYLHSLTNNRKYSAHVANMYPHDDDDDNDDYSMLYSAYLPTGWRW
jgi:hypothetical protein